VRDKRTIAGGAMGKTRIVPVGNRW
jgi:hypothetical protein